MALIWLQISNEWKLKSVGNCWIAGGGGGG